MKKVLTFFFFINFFAFFETYAAGVIVPTDLSQNDFLRAYKFAITYSNVDYRFTNSTMDSVLFPKFGEFSIYWVREGTNRGSFIYPDALPKDFSTIISIPFSNYQWNSVTHYSLQFKPRNNLVCIFQSEFLQNNSTVSWAAFYFKNLFDMAFYDNIYFFANEKLLDSIGLPPPTRLLIVPPFRKMGEDDKFYIDLIVKKYPNIKSKIEDFLSLGGTIYAEGNAAYFLEKLGILPSNTLDFNSLVFSNVETNLINVSFEKGNTPLHFLENSVENQLYGTYFPKVNFQQGEVIARETSSGIPVLLLVKGKEAKGGKIIINTGLPTVGGMNNLNKGSRQLQWALNAILYAFCSTVDVTRSIFNELPPEITAGRNAISYDRLDTFEVRIKVRNLTDKPVTNISITEYIRNYFKFVGIRNNNITFNINGNTFTINEIALQPFQEVDVVVLISTPDPTDKVHEDVNKYISWANYIYVSYSEIKNENGEGIEFFVKYRNYADVMFSARLVADTDLNWKNFLYEDFQPFKVFTILENKERTPALETKYVQYIPKDVPFYWTDKNINIPILRTPGGKYVDILRGSNDLNNPEYDMDGDGYPDVWLDTSSIFPKGYKLEEIEVYWLNPWEHLRSGDTLFYEDINHDGKRAKDIDGDGVVDIEAPGDKIRVWKVTWDIGKVAGYEYFDPYCYYEIWVDPPNLVSLSAGVAYTQNKLDKPIKSMFYPYSKDINKPNLADTSWTHWMERDKNGNVIWKQLIFQSIHNYEGFTFIDTLKEGYKLKPTDRCYGTVPQPHREYIAVLSLGGKEIDMDNPTPSSSNYSNLIYKTIFNETRVTPIRTTYTYWAPLPNPLQFEYLTNSFIITDTTGTIQYQHLPKFGKALITFTMDASTEYSYYWIRNAGHDVDYNDPSLEIEGIDELGDGVFGYIIYDIPKGIGGHKITLPKKPDGSYDIEKIVKIDGKPYQPWIDNQNTRKEIRIIEDPFVYHIHIPQILIPPALDDDNNDGIDDWIDDRGDRFKSETGFLPDPFMLEDGEQWLDWPKTPFKDGDFGIVKSGWYSGPDNTYGDDEFEKLGKTRIQIQAIYEGHGREGCIEISKGGWLVVEEIFGGSPWVISSHTLSGYSTGTNIALSSKVQPSTVRFGIDTAYILHTVEDIGEPHSFDINFDPFHISYGYGDITITSFAGGRDPCNLISPNIPTSTIIDPKINRADITILPFADSTKPEFKGYPKTISGTFLEVRVEINNSTDDNLVNVKIEPFLPSELKNTHLVFSYVSYPRPLVPAKFNPSTGKIIRGGDDFATLRTGWRFNQPEGEVLVELGNNLNFIQPTRKAYFVFLFQIDSTLPNGVYSIGFKLDGERIYYTGEKRGRINYEVPQIQFSITKRNFDESVAEFQKFVIGKSNLNKLDIFGTNAFRGLKDVRWNSKPISYTDFYNLNQTLKVNFDPHKNIESIDLSQFKNFPTVDFTKFYLLEKIEVNSSFMPEKFNITNSEELSYTVLPFGDYIATDKQLTLTSVGPKVTHTKKITSINGKQLQESENLFWSPDNNHLVVTFYVINTGSDLAEDVSLEFTSGTYFNLSPNQPKIIQKQENVYSFNLGGVVPGEIRQINVEFDQNPNLCQGWYNSNSIIKNVVVRYNGPRFKNSLTKEAFYYSDNNTLIATANDIYIPSIIPSESFIQPNKGFNFKYSIANGLTEFTTPFIVSSYAILNLKDTILLKEDTITSFAPLEKLVLEASLTISDSIYFVELLIIADSRNSINEICKSNNIKLLTLNVDSPILLNELKSNPNPIEYSTVISYIISQSIYTLEASLYSIDGRLIKTIDNCPHKVGFNQFSLNLENIAKGTYVLRFDGITTENKKFEQTLKIVKEK